MSDEVETRVSIGLDPEAVIGTIDDYDDDTSSYLSPGTSALTEAYSALRAIHDAKAAAETDQRMNKFGALLKTDDYASKRMAKVWDLWSAAETSLTNRVTAWEQEMSKEVEQKAGQRVSGEVRAHFKGLKPGERMPAVSQAIQAGDETVATAVLGAPAMLSGLDEDMRAILLREWHEKTNPAMAKRLRAASQMLGAIQERVPVLRTELKKAVGDIKEYKEGKGGQPILVRTWTPAEVRARAKASDEPFAVGL